MKAFIGKVQYMGFFTLLMASALLMPAYIGFAADGYGGGGSSGGGTSAGDGGGSATGMMSSVVSTSKLRANLTGSAIGGTTPSGRADWNLVADSGHESLLIQVEDVNLPDGTVLYVSGCGSSNIGTLLLRARKANLIIDESEGSSVPTCTAGNKIFVANGGKNVLSGTFATLAVAGTATASDTSETGTTATPTTSMNREAILQITKTVFEKFVSILAMLNSALAALPR